MPTVAVAFEIRVIRVPTAIQACMAEEGRNKRPFRPLSDACPLGPVVSNLDSLSTLR